MSSLIDILKAEEGLRLKVYDDNNGNTIKPGTRVIGHPTIGYGRALERKGITEPESLYLLENDIAEVRNQVRTRIPWSQRLSPNRLAVLEAMAYQMGIEGLLLFKNTLTMIEKGDYVGGAAGMLNSKWARTDSPARALRMSEIMRKG